MTTAEKILSGEAVIAKERKDLREKILNRWRKKRGAEGCFVLRDTLGYTAEILPAPEGNIVLYVYRRAPSRNDRAPFCFFTRYGADPEDLKKRSASAIEKDRYYTDQTGRTFEL